ncbi:hemin transporter, partial [Streptomyces sp. 4F]
MLSEQSVPVVRATLPAVGAAIGDITALFYRKLFDAHPELLRDLFNRGNQANGEQQRALAGSIAAFAGMLLERPDARPDALLSRIAHKHASLGVTSDQYKVVHRHLFAAIADVLGDAVTPEVAAAWDEVYWLMANALVAVETRLYQEAEVAEGEVWHSMEITERREETPDAVSFVLRPVDGRPTRPFRPGQYVGVRSSLPDGSRQIRQYSLSAAPGRTDWRITVKRVRGDGRPDGEVSSWLHAHARPGDVLTVSAPFGDLALEESDGPLLLASAGIGVTPVLSMLDHLAATGSTRPVTVVHADSAPADHAHRQEQLDLVRALPDARLHLWYEEPGDGAPEAAAGL